MDRPGEAFGPALELMGDVGELYMVSVFVIARTEKRCLFEHARVISNYAKANNKATYLFKEAKLKFKPPSVPTNYSIERPTSNDLQSGDSFDMNWTLDLDVSYSYRWYSTVHAPHREEGACPRFLKSATCIAFHRGKGRCQNCQI